MNESGGIRAIGHTQTAEPTAMPLCFLPAVLLVCAEISPIRLALAAQAGHVAPEGSLASLQIRRNLFFLPILPPTQSFCLATVFVEI